jgi:hypothetical protein
MAAIKVYLDEDVHGFIADALRLRGWHTLTTPEAGSLRTSDIDQITYATQNGYSLLTYNVTDFPRLHNEILATGGTHAGIIVATQERPSANARALLSLLDAFGAEDFVDQLIYLSNWITDLSGTTGVEHAEFYFVA